jgi:tyrosine-protein kinase Etk/Wzc
VSDGGAPKPILDYLLVIVKWRKVVLLNLVAVALGAAVLSFVAPAWYTSRASLIPTESSTGEIGLFSLLETSFPLLRIPGVSTPSETMVAILTSRRVAEEVIRENGLQKLYRARTMDHAVTALERRMGVDVDENGVVRIQAEARDRELAASIVASLVASLERYNAEVRSTTGRKAREFVEARLAQAVAELRTAENALAAFQRKNASIQIDEQAKAAIGAMAEIESRAATAEIKLAMLRTYASPSHPEVKRLENEVRRYREALESVRTGAVGEGAPDLLNGIVLAPLASMPALALEYVRLARDVEVLNTVYLFLVQELETAKIQEAKDTPTVQILDAPTRPEIRTRPIRKLMVAVGALIGLLVGVTLAFYLEFLATTDAGNPARRTLNAIAAAVRGDIRRLGGRGGTRGG